MNIKKIVSRCKSSRTIDHCRNKMVHSRAIKRSIKTKLIFMRVVDHVQGAAPGSMNNTATYYPFQFNTIKINLQNCNLIRHLRFVQIIFGRTVFI